MVNRNLSLALRLDNVKRLALLDGRSAAQRAGAFVLLVSLAGTLATMAQAQDSISAEVVLKDHIYHPAEIRVPSGKPFVITIHNEDATPEEFESSALKIEKIIPGKSTASVHVRPLTAGRYSFVGEQHEDTAKGELVAE
jgi:hypothetical protein